MHSQFLLQLISIQIIPPRSNIPAPKPLTINTMKVDLANECRPIVFRDIRTVRALERLVLGFDAGDNVSEAGEGLVFDVCAAVGECCVVETEESAEDAELGEGFVDDVLVGAWEIGGDYPVEVNEGRCEDDVYVFVGFLVDAGGCPSEIRFAVWWSR